MGPTFSRILLAMVVGCVVCEPGCSRSSSRGTGHSPPAVAPGTLTAEAAAQLAARLANDRCERQYHKQPFSAAQCAAVLKDGAYEWGGLDVGGTAGFSALVTFKEDGSEPHVEVHFSTDLLTR